jgi:ribosomal protein S27E
MRGLLRPPGKVERRYGKKCPHCGLRQVWYSRKWDADFCNACNTWLEEKCGFKTVEECSFRCWLRPKRPLRRKKVARTA